MKTAEEILIEHHTQRHNDKMFSQHNWNLPDIIDAMKEFARQAVEVALKDASENAKVNMISKPNGVCSELVFDTNSILNRKSEILIKLGL